MNMNCKYKYIYSTVYLLILIAFTGCSASVDIKAANDKSAQAQVKLNLGKILCDTIDSLTAGINEISASGTQSAPETTQIFSKQEIETAFSGSDFQDLKVEVPAKDSVSISGTIPSPENQKSFSDKGNLKIANFITCTKNSLTLILSPATLRTFASSLPEETRSYLDLLMAPVLTQESMNAQEYRELVSTVYGEKMAAEMESAQVRITLCPPDGASIKKTSLSSTERARTLANKAVLNIPLSEFLTLSEPKTFSITW